MLDQKVSAKAFLKMTSLKDIIRLDLGRNRDEYLRTFQAAIDLITNNSHNFDDITIFTIKGKSVYKIDTIASLYMARHINILLRRLYRIKQSNRDIITHQISSLLSETSPYYVIKGDISNFYESIPQIALLNKLKEDRLLDSKYIKIIERIFGNSLVSDPYGVPRGISFSSTLGELYLRSFDEAIRRIPGVYYYSRYVDDFVIFTHRPDLNLNDVRDELSKLSLNLNPNKAIKFNSKLLHSDRQRLTFIGYEHIINDKGLALVRISRKRVRRIKTRIILSFLDFFKNKNINLFRSRIEFITGNYVICTNQSNDKKLLAGFYYNNSSITDFSQISDLDRFLMSICHSSYGFFPKTITKSLRKSISLILKDCHFSKGFNSRVVYAIDVKNFKKIKECWSREYLYEKK